MIKNAKTSDTSDNPSLASPFLSGHKIYVLFILFLVYAFNFVDRQILAILAEPIKAEFDLKDWQLGFLTGTAFALFYATLGIPIALLADRWHRVNIIAIALTIWSAMTALCALTTNFTQLALARIGVGVGEAGGSPPAVSLLSSYFHREQRSTAMGIYSLGSTMGILVGFIAGGWINELYGWRAALIVVGLPGIILALVVKFTIKEPRREFSNASKTDDAAPELTRVVRVLFSIKTFRFVQLAAAAAGFTVYGFMIWMPVYLIREFEMTTGEVGTAMGLIAGFAGGAGAFFGGFLADKMSESDIKWQMRLPALTIVVFLPLLLLVLNANTAQQAIILLVPTYMFSLAYTGPTWAIVQTVSPVNMRATAAAITLFIINLIGLGMGPQFIGILSDLFEDRIGTDALSYAIGIVSTTSLIAGLSFYLASNSMVKDIEGNKEKPLI